ncbi:MAG: hypothetical protein K5739_04965 [Lachnospiraceae bacterium]|nr:hypothetical protein [Lachnospiraceae bacterium]
MKRGYVKTVLMSLALTLGLFAGSSVDAFADKASDAAAGSVLTLNEVKTDSIEQKGGEKWYQFNLTEAGYFRIHIGPGEKVDKDEIGWGWEAAFYKKGELEESIIEIGGVDSLKKSCWLAFDPGTYYIQVKERNEMYDTKGNPFDLKVEFNKSDIWESESNGNYKVADVIKTNTTYKGNLYNKDDVDYYKYTVTKDGYQSITVTPDPDLRDEEDLGWGWNITVLDADGSSELFALDKITATKTTLNYPMKKGDYYVKVQAEAPAFSPKQQVYDLKVNETEAAGWEAEHNDLQKDANPISLDTPYKALTYRGEDKDFFTFDIPVKGIVTLNMAKDPDTDSDKVSWGWDVELTAENGSKSVFSKDKVTTSITEEMVLPAGKYYLLVKPTSSYFWPKECMYNFSVKYEGFDQAMAKTTVKIKKPKAKGGKITVKWNKNDLASGYEVYRSTKAKKGFKKVKSVSSKKLSYVDKKVKAKKTYYYKVRAYIKVDGKKYYSQYSAVKKVKAK